MLAEKEAANEFGGDRSQADNGSHAGIHRIIVLAAAADLDHISTLMRHSEYVLLAALPEKQLYVLAQLPKEHRNAVVYSLILLVAEEQGAAGVDIDNGAHIVLLDADHHNGLAGVGPVLKHDLILQLKRLLHAL